jgi:hypothetical protein
MILKKSSTSLPHDLLSLFTKPFQSETFDFSDEVFFENIALLGERFAKDPNLRKMNGNRGSSILFTLIEHSLVFII